MKQNLGSEAFAHIFCSLFYDCFRLSEAITLTASFYESVQRVLFAQLSTQLS